MTQRRLLLYKPQAAGVDFGRADECVAVGLLYSDAFGLCLHGALLMIGLEHHRRWNRGTHGVCGVGRGPSSIPL